MPLAEINIKRKASSGYRYDLFLFYSLSQVWKGKGREGNWTSFCCFVWLVVVVCTWSWSTCGTLPPSTWTLASWRWIWLASGSDRHLVVFALVCHFFKKLKFFLGGLWHRPWLDALIDFCARGRWFCCWLAVQELGRDNSYVSETLFTFIFASFALVSSHTTGVLSVQDPCLEGQACLFPWFISLQRFWASPLYENPGW